MFWKKNKHNGSRYAWPFNVMFSDHSISPHFWVFACKHLSRGVYSGVQRKLCLYVSSWHAEWMCCNFPPDIIGGTGPWEKDTGTSDRAIVLTTHVHLFLINKTVTFFKLASTFSAFLHPPTREQPKHCGIIFWQRLCWLQKYMFVGMNYMLSCFTVSKRFHFSWWVGRKRPEKAKQTRAEWDRSPSHDFPPQGPGLEID